MKNLRITLITLFIAIASINSYPQTTNNAVEYMNSVFNPLLKAKDDTWQYLKAVTRGKGARKVEAKRQNLISELRSAKLEVQRVGKYKGDDQLKKAIVAYLDLSNVVLNEDFDKILNMEDIAEQSYDLMEAYLLAKEQAGKKLNDSFEEVKNAQKTFASANNITLIAEKDDEISKKIEKANETLKYYNEVYLIFFKVYKQEAYVLDAMSRNDVNALEQNIGTLSLNSKEGLEKIAKLEGYRGDSQLKSGSQRIVNFYKKEADKDFPTITDFYIKKDNFEKVKKTFDAISPKKRTQQDIDQYNKAVNEFNEATKKVNAVNETLNNERKKGLNDWNNTVEKFFDIHSN